MESKLENLSLEVTEFIFNEANKKFNSVNDSTDILDKKGFGIFTILFTILVLIVSFTIKDISNINYIKPYIILLFGFVVSFALLLKSVWTIKYYGNSFLPEQILEADISFLKDKKTLLESFLISWYNNAIKHNISINKRRGQAINLALSISSLSLSIFIMYYVFLKISFPIN